MPIGKLAKWQILLSEFDIVYMTESYKGTSIGRSSQRQLGRQGLQTTHHIHLDEKVLFTGEDIAESYSGWRMFFDGEKSLKGVGIGAVQISESGQHYSASTKLRFSCANNMVEYEAFILKIRTTIDMNIKELLVIGDSGLLIQNGYGDALATLSSMIQHPDKNYIDPIKIEVQDQHAYCFHVDEELGEVRTKKTSNKRTLDLGMLRCVDAAEATRLLKELYAGTCGPHMNGFTLAKKILKAGYFWMTVEKDNICYVQKFHKCQIHRDFIWVPPNELNVMGSPWPFAAWGMDVIRPIEPAVSNRHHLILVYIDYFTKWVEASMYKAVTKKSMVDFVHGQHAQQKGETSSIHTGAASCEEDIPSSRRGKRQIHPKMARSLRGPLTIVKKSIDRRRNGR
ncbi:uncharacterized protein [Nicotiana tomentosiformis]|uniref:uncharacterized protein n=1 Tax=Nicotiana tomentosiformis TaxID=4098 RepID=UPI00388CD7F0